jgi:hypothetical protein
MLSPFQVSNQFRFQRIRPSRERPLQANNLSSPGARQSGLVELTSDLDKFISCSVQYCFTGFHRIRMISAMLV